MFQKKKAVPIKLPQIEFADIRQSETFFFQKKQLISLAVIIVIGHYFYEL